MNKYVTTTQRKHPASWARRALPVALSSLLALLSFHSISAETAGKTMIVKGLVEAFETNENKRTLKRRSPIFDIDTVSTQAKSKAQFRMNDGTLLALKASSKVLISEYQYQPGKENNSAVIELVEGGLRSITGAIKANNGNYEVRTPIGSIGIRGTHFEIELIDGDMFVAVWDGAIDISVDTGTGSDTVSFGEGEDFSFGVVNQEGEVTELLEAPTNFDSGHSSEQEGDESSSEEQDGNSPNAPDNEEDDQANGNGGSGEEESTQGSEDGGSQGGNTPNTSPQDDSGESGLGGNGLVEEPLDTTLDESNSGTLSDETTVLEESEDVSKELVEETITQNDIADPDVIAARTGEFSYQGLIEGNVTSSLGGAAGLEVNMTVDFENGFVPDGTLSFTDNGGEWFAAFNGVIDLNELLLGINFATHGDALADGDISAFFADDGNRISGQFSLFEIENPNVNANGRFQIE